MGGTNTGKMALWDWRVGKGYQGLIRKFGGCVGAVREIATQPGNQYFCAVGVWRHGAGGKVPTHKIYLKSRLNCVLMTSDFDPEKVVKEEEKEEVKNTCERTEDSDDDIQVIEDSDEGVEDDVSEEKAEENGDELWDNMIVINK